MKKKLIISLMVALVMVLTPAPALAYSPWDVEDSCVADNEDFVYGSGSDHDISPNNVQAHWGNQWGNGDGFNLCRDEGSGFGGLDVISSIWTLTPNKIDLPIEGTVGVFTVMGEAIPDAWYWALKPGGYNLPPAPSEAYNRYKGLSGVFWVEVLNYSGFDTYKWDNQGSVDRVLRDDVIASNKVNGTICTLYIQEGTHLSFPGRPSTLVTNLFVERDDCGDIYFEPGNMDFSQECAIVCVSGGVEEVVTFTQIRGGLPVQD